LVFEEIGETAFRFAFVFSIVTTVLIVGLLAAGFPVDVLSDIPLFMPSTRLYSYTQDVVGRLPQEASAADLVIAVATIYVTGFAQFVFIMLSGVIALVYTIASLLPPQLVFLTFPLYFVGALVQVMVWYYASIRVLASLRSWLPI